MGPFQKAALRVMLAAGRPLTCNQIAAVIEDTYPFSCNGYQVNAAFATVRKVLNRHWAKIVGPYCVDARSERLWEITPRGIDALTGPEEPPRSPKPKPRFVRSPRRYRPWYFDRANA